MPDARPLSRESVIRQIVRAKADELGYRAGEMEDDHVAIAEAVRDAIADFINRRCHPITGACVRPAEQIDAHFGKGSSR